MDMCLYVHANTKFHFTMRGEVGGLGRKRQFSERGRHSSLSFLVLSPVNGVHAYFLSYFIVSVDLNWQ